MKTKFISKATTFTYIAFVACCILFLLSCGGCGSRKMAEEISLTHKINDTSLTEEKSSSKTAPSQSDSSQQSSDGSIRYPYYNEKRGITYLDDQTIEFQGVKQITNGPEIKIIFPNGKTISNIKDAAIMKDVPKEAQVYYQSSEEDLFIKEVDLKKVSKAQRAKWFSQMKLNPDVKLSDLDYMIINSHMLDLDETPGRVCLAVYAEVWSEMGDLVGRIAHLDIYDYDGKLILQIPMYEYGGERFTVTKDQKYLLCNVNGSRFGDSDFGCGLLNPQIRIYTFEDGKFYTQLNLPCCEFSCGSQDSIIAFSINGGDFSGYFNTEKRIVKIIKNVQEILNGGPTQRTIEGILTNDGKLWKFETYSFDEWNTMDLSIFEENRQ